MCQMCILHETTFASNLLDSWMESPRKSAVISCFWKPKWSFSCAFISWSMSVIGSFSDSLMMYVFLCHLEDIYHIYHSHSPVTSGTSNLVTIFVVCRIHASLAVPWKCEANLRKGAGLSGVSGSAPKPDRYERSCEVVVLYAAFLLHLWNFIKVARLLKVRTLLFI